ncbi:hypothetical protein JL49_05340 [Pseudoalteromonas luteoviolacea]|uniref:Solute-binding protein family 3/N-terminal domain-containing protein n=1 Tax=Pseudoalteromonas luteoviolacea NCIMB 1942 TaxID=1365253 RepID=A0A162A481_9GAMM|nr:hypothetical protein N482_18660 [Pseudoalteromonas luteoviolacea NCIMB 1942]KZX01535.1 hypothetical protein JL49_05340 [Pseudoalteromonas luteoviolacea]
MNIVIIGLILTFSIASYATINITPPTKLTISYIDHPSVLNQALPLVAQAYQAERIDVDFVAIPSHRLINEIQAQHIDGDVILAKEIFSPYKELIAVGPPLTKVQFVLLCVEGVPCNLQVLQTSPKTILATDESMRVILNKFPTSRRNRYYQLNQLGKLPHLLQEKRFEYAIYVMSSSWPIPQALEHLNRHTLFETPAYHVVHKKHAAIANRIAPRLTAILNKQRK